VITFAANLFASDLNSKGSRFSALDTFSMQGAFMSALRMFIPITKVDAARRLVYGLATAETEDRAGEICDYASTKPLYEKWSEEIAKSTRGKSFGNLRAMHGPVAAGKVTAITFNDAGKQIEICAKVVDDAEWAKVVEGVYTGFSQGGDNYRLSPDTMWVNSQEALNISHKILAGSAVAAQRFVFNSERDSLGGGIMVRTYLNKFSMQGGSVIDIKVHPNMPAGTILMTTKMLPYPLAGVGNVVQIRTRQDYYQIEWPLVTRKYEYGVYADEVLQNYFPPSLALITNIGNG
jgi:hypothetical protein